MDSGRTDIAHRLEKGHPKTSLSGRNLLRLILVLLPAVVLPIFSYLYFPSDLLWDDAAFVLKYVENITAGYGYRFNATDAEPIFGSSSFLFTILAALLKLVPYLSHDFLFVRLPGLLGYSVTLLLSFRIPSRQCGLIGGLLGMLMVASVPQYFSLADSG
ncbi:MAG: hypothetical protein P8182_16330, partial [Deltaproteobacteria bacterium]